MPTHFKEEDLRLAHRLHYHKDLVDIISMVKHAADEAAPLFNPEERAARAIEHVSAGRRFTAERSRWLERIREHVLLRSI